MEEQSDNIENSKPSTSNEALSKNTDKNCKGCGGVFAITRILKHITHTSCEEQYAEEEMKSLKEMADERTKKRKKGIQGQNQGN